MDGMKASRSELGDFLRSRRAGLNPQAIGLPARRRRTPGLRREEVAELANIGVDWYIRLEQGRAVSPSPTTIDALARALRLSKAEHRHLSALASGTNRRIFQKEAVSDELLSAVDAIRQPAYITGRRWDVLAWNKPAADLFGFKRMADDDRNILIMVLLSPGARRMFGSNWAKEAKRVVARFRSDHDLWAGDPSFVALLERLRKECPEFAGWWEAHEILDLAGGIKRLRHPRKGMLNLLHASFQCNDNPDLKLIIYSAKLSGARNSQLR